jgi:hypothetical protein
MTSSMDALLTLAHTDGAMMIAILALATAGGFIVGLFFDRAGRRSQNDEK